MAPMATRAFSSIARSALRTTALVSLSAGISASIVLNRIEQSSKAPSAPATDSKDTVRAKQVEVINDKGEVCLRLYGGPHGGVVEWRRPGRMVNGEEKPIFAHLGSYFPGHVDFGFGDPTGDSTVGLSMSIGGMPQRGVITFNGLNGAQAMRVETWPFNPTLTINNASDGTVKFQK